MRISCDFGPWQHRRGKYYELTRVCDFVNLVGLGTKTQIELCCGLTIEEQVQAAPKSIFGNEIGVTSFAYVVFGPHLLEQTTRVAVFFAPTGEITRYEIVSAKLQKAYDGDVSFLVFDHANADKLINVLMLGREVTVRILRGVPSTGWIRAALSEEGSSLPYSEECVAPFIPLKNDPSFQSEYELLKSALMTAPRCWHSEPAVSNSNVAYLRKQALPINADISSSFQGGGHAISLCATRAGTGTRRSRRCWP